jgi:hypothetical protein
MLLYLQNSYELKVLNIVRIFFAPASNPACNMPAFSSPARALTSLYRLLPPALSPGSQAQGSRRSELQGFLAAGVLLAVRLELRLRLGGSGGGSGKDGPPPRLRHRARWPPASGSCSSAAPSWIHGICSGNQERPTPCPLRWFAETLGSLRC